MATRRGSRTNAGERVGHYGRFNWQGHVTAFDFLFEKSLKIGDGARLHRAVLGGHDLQTELRVPGQELPQRLEFPRIKHTTLQYLEYAFASDAGCSLDNLLKRIVDE